MAKPQHQQRKSTAIFKNTFKTHLENSEMPTKRIAQKNEGKNEKIQRKQRANERERENKTMLMPKGKRWVSYQGAPRRVQEKAAEEE